jgi:hypothetical protein
VKFADTGDEKLGPDAPRDEELADDELDGVTGGILPLLNPSAAKEDAPSSSLFQPGV